MRSWTPEAIKAAIGMLFFLRDLGAHALDLPMLPAERRRFLYSVGHRLTGQALLRHELSRRQPIMLAQSAIGVLDDVSRCSIRQSRPAREGRSAS
jgi:hypothetical protein